MRKFRFGVSLVQPRSGREWRDQARRVEDLGFDVLTVPDHLDAVFPPFPGLTAAAAATEHLRVGTLTCNNDFRNPVVLASEAAALDLLSDGRFELGLGAGHAFPEYERAGLVFDPASVRIERLGEAVEIVQGLFRGEPVTFAGRHYDVQDAQLYAGPVQARLPVLVGGWGPKLLDLAARKADIVGLTGLGATGADGRNHAPSGFTAAAVDERMAFVRERIGDREVEIHALVQAVFITDDRDGAAERFAGEVEGLAPQDVLDCPFVLVGTVPEIGDEINAHRERWGISYFTTFEPFLDALALVIADVS